MNVQFNLKAKYLVVGALAFTGVAFWQSNKPLDYEFSSVYDSTNHHHSVLVHTDSNNSKYNVKCADEVSANLLKANITNYDIKVVNEGEYELVYYQGNKIK